MIGFFGLMAEIKTPGWGLAGTSALIALTIFFGSSYILQLASILEILLFVLGLILLLAEIFIIPGFGIAGISGIAMIFASIFLSLLGSNPFLDMQAVSMAIIQLSGSLLFALVGMFFLIKYLPKSTAFNKLVLSESEKAEHGFVSYPSEKDLVGKTGIAFTTLRPGGTAEIDGRRIDVVADSEYIDQNVKIRVLRVEGIKVVVTIEKS
jgi:membrane-bound serine protease (ClpP class)